jgi:hypothetical protein
MQEAGIASVNTGHSRLMVKRREQLLVSAAAGGAPRRWASASFCFGLDACIDRVLLDRDSASTGIRGCREIWLESSNASRDRSRDSTFVFPSERIACAYIDGLIQSLQLRQD